MINMLLSLAIDDDGRVTGHVVEQTRDVGPPPPLPGQTKIEDHIDEVQHDATEGRLFDAPKTVDDNTAAASAELHRAVRAELEALGCKVDHWALDEQTAAIIAGHREPYRVGGPDGTVRAVVTVGASEKTLRDPKRGWSVAKDAMQAQRALAKALGVELWYVFQDRNCARSDQLVEDETMFKGEGGDGRFWVIKRAGWRPTQEVFS